MLLWLFKLLSVLKTLLHSWQTALLSGWRCCCSLWRFKVNLVLSIFPHTSHRWQLGDTLVTPNGTCRQLVLNDTATGNKTISSILVFHHHFIFSLNFFFYFLFSIIIDFFIYIKCPLYRWYELFLVFETKSQNKIYIYIQKYVPILSYYITRSKDTQQTQQRVNFKYYILNNPSRLLKIQYFWIIKYIRSSL